MLVEGGCGGGGVADAAGAECGVLVRAAPLLELGGGTFAQGSDMSDQGVRHPDVDVKACPDRPLGRQPGMYADAAPIQPEGCGRRPHPVPGPAAARGPHRPGRSRDRGPGRLRGGPCASVPPRQSTASSSPAANPSTALKALRPSRHSERPDADSRTGSAPLFRLNRDHRQRLANGCTDVSNAGGRCRRARPGPGRRACPAGRSGRKRARSRCP